MNNLELDIKKLAKKESLTKRNAGELILARSLKIKKLTTTELHHLYNLAVKLRLAFIQNAIAEKIRKIKPVSSKEEFLVKIIILHNCRERELQKQLFS